MSALQSMQIPPQEDWSLELLHELQRAVPVLENSSFNLDDEIDVEDVVAVGASASIGGSDTGWSPTRDDVLAASGASDTQFTGAWDPWECGDEAGADGNSANILSDDAMALPMSTLTSGKRKTYPNRSTFQAHVCCVMHPSQVPHVLQTLQASPHFQSVRHWPYAYRIISPFDGQSHEGSDDGEDCGAGERMLALLQRMGLENLLLIVSRWDTGPPDRLGLELFRCINQQCKELLRELQQAVRASFPPEELLRADFVQNPDGETQIEDGFAEIDNTDGPITDADYGVLEDDLEADTVHQEQDDETSKSGARLFDFSALGSTPQLELWHKVFSGYPVRSQAARLQEEWDETLSEDVARTVQQEALEVTASCGLHVKAAPVNTRVAPPKRNRVAKVEGKGKGKGNRASAAAGAVASSAEQLSAATLASQTASTPAKAEHRTAHGSAGGKVAARVNSEGSGSCADDHNSTLSGEIAGDEDDEVAKQRRLEWMSRMTSEELLRYGAELRMDRLSLEERLSELGHAAEVIRNLNAPFFEGIADVEPEDKRVQGSAAKHHRRMSRMIKQDVLSFNKRQSHIHGFPGKGKRQSVLQKDSFGGLGNSLKSAGLFMLGNS